MPTTEQRTLADLRAAMTPGQYQLSQVIRYRRNETPIIRDPNWTDAAVAEATLELLTESAAVSAFLRADAEGDDYGQARAIVALREAHEASAAKLGVAP